MRIILEVLRVICIMLVLGVLLSSLLNMMYGALGIDLINNKFAWLIWFAVYFIIFVLYRNKLQFSGWYKGKELKKLSKPESLGLIICAVIMLLIIPLG